MDLSIFGFLLQDGLATGAVYVLLAVSLVMVFTVTRIVLVPQGEFVSFAALTLASLDQGRTPGLAWILPAAGAVAFAMDASGAWRRGSARGLPASAALFLAAPAVLATAATFAIDAGAPMTVKIALAGAMVVALGPILYRIAFQPMASASPLHLLIAAIALHFVLIGAGLYLFGPEGVRTPALVDGTAEILGVPVATQTLMIVAASLLLNLALFGFFGFTLHGKALRATAVNRRGALLVGVSPDYAGQCTFALAAAIGALSGVLIGPVTTIYYDSGFLLGLKGFVGAIIGGLVGYPMAAAGALAVGLLEAFSSFWASAYKEVTVFTLIVPILLWRSLAHPVAEDDHD